VEGLHILHRAIAGDAFDDSAERYPPPRCHPNTRTKLLDVLRNWACGIEPPQNCNILWLYGPAGSGKSALAQSFCEKLKEEGHLGGSFFFKRGDSSRGNAKKLFPTIAYQLAHLLPDVNRLISEKIEKDPAIVDRSLPDQLQKLIIEPCQRSCLSQAVSVVIDGLDECDGTDIQEEVLRSIGNAASREHLPILFLIASRPESHIRETFANFEGFHRGLNINQSVQDVRTYLFDEFSRIHREHQTMASVPSPWPRSEIVDDLVNKASGYFIYVATVIKFIDDKQFRPVDRLDIILGIQSTISASPFEPIDQLYYQILCAVSVDFRVQLLGILAVMAARFFFIPVSSIEGLLYLEPGNVRLILRNLHSVIRIPEEDNMLLGVHHASFLDFLDEPVRSGPFCVGTSQCRTYLASQILKAFSYQHDDPCSNQVRRFGAR
ncbi:hypothetical protein B0H13DRAFT_1663528, partial [Mycena leptocephala]